MRAAVTLPLENHNKTATLEKTLTGYLRQYLNKDPQGASAELIGWVSQLAEKIVVRMALTDNGDNISQTARQLGMARKSLYQKMRKYKITANQRGDRTDEAQPKVNSPTNRRLRALISVSDKTHLLTLARALQKHNIDLIATGGTARALHQGGIEHNTVENLTGAAEMMDGRVKTLNPRIFGAILARLPEDQAELTRHLLTPIDIVVVNLYPFVQVLNDGQGTEQQLCDNIDIGGVALLRAAAKNYRRVCVVCQPDQYAEFIETLANGDLPDQAARRRLAEAAFNHTSAYDHAIGQWLTTLNRPDDQTETSTLPAHYHLRLSSAQELRYGENPHQSGGLYQPDHGQAPWQQLQGKQVSYNNLIDSDCALRLVTQLSSPACVIVKHDTPCAVALGRSGRDSFLRALATDSESAFGGIVAFNCSVDQPLARAIVDNVFTEIVVAPGFSEQSQATFAAKKNLRLLAYRDSASKDDGWHIKRVVAGWLLQSPIDTQVDFQPAGRYKTKLTADVELAWRTVAFCHSNAIVVVRAGRTIGVAAGTTSRVRAVDQALERARAFAQLHPEKSTQWVLASDAFFPFRDSVDLAAEAGVSVIVQPGGSRRDKEVIAAADQHKIALLFTGQRVFRH